MAVCEAEALAGKLLEYFRKRHYIVGDKVLKEKLNVSGDESLIYSDIDKASSRPNITKSSTTLPDLSLAEQQFLVLKASVAELVEEQCQNDLLPVLMPLLCHMYLESLRRTPRPSSLKFLKRLYPPLITEEWTPLIEQLLAINTLLEIPLKPLVKQFRESKIVFKVLPRSISLLKRFLRTKSLYVLIPVLQTWFEFIAQTDDILSGEEDMSELAGPCAENGNVDEDDSDPAQVDKEMEELVHLIKLKRMQPMPAPPLHLYSLHNTDHRIVCGKASIGCRRLVATGDQNSQVKVWSWGETRNQSEFHPSYFRSVPIDLPTEPIIDFRHLNKETTWTLRGHCDTVYDVEFISNDDFLLSVSFDTTMRLWNLNDFSCEAVYRGHTSPIWAVAVSPISNFIGTASHDKTARLWSVDRTFPLRIMAGHNQDVTCVDFHPNGTYMATGSPDRTLRLWSVTDGNLVRVMGGQPGQGAIGTITFSPNGQFVASAGDDANVWLWDIASGSLLCQLVGHTSRILSIDWSKDGSTLSASAMDGTVLLWPLDNPTACKKRVVTKKYVTKCTPLLSLQYSSKNSLLAVGIL